MDTFILDVLRGWRLLVAASLSSEEWRDVLATTTNNKLDYLSVSDALQTLWDEQMGSGRWASGSSQQHQQFWAETAYDPSWYDSFQVWQPSWSEDCGHRIFGTIGKLIHQTDDATGNPPADCEGDDALTEALEAEKAAEALAVEARRTWSQAQQATANLRRDRGFGKSSSSSKVGCFICGGPHLQKD